MLNDTDPNSRRVVLNSCKGPWEIDVKKCDHGCLHFLGKTWEVYVSDHNLKEGDTIVFEHKGHLRFNTIMFDKMGREKDFAISEEEEEEEEESSSEYDVEKDSAFSEEEEERTSEHVQHLDEMDQEHGIDGEDDVPIRKRRKRGEQNSISQFEVKLAEWNFTHNYMTVPQSFATSNDMMQDRSVKLKNGTRDSWRANFFVSRSKRKNGAMRARLLLSSLFDFMRDNDLKVGDTCIFKLVQHSTRLEHVVMDVVVLRKP